MREWRMEQRRSRPGEGDWDDEREYRRRGYGTYGPGEVGAAQRGMEDRETPAYGGGGYWGGESWGAMRGEPGEGRWRGGAGPGPGAVGRSMWGQGRFTGVYGPDWTRGGPDWERGYGGGWGRGYYGEGTWGPHAGRGPRTYQRSDERIRDDVNDRLTDDPWIDASDIEVAVQGRIVTLTGKVGSRDAKRRAEDIAESCSGVLDVSNELRVERREGVMEQIGEALTGREQR